MFTAGYSLISDVSFDFAKNNKIIVTVWKQDTLLEIGPIDSFCDLTVIILNKVFFRTNCDFKVQETIF